MSKKRKVRAEFRKNRSQRPRPTGWTRQFTANELNDEELLQQERVSGKGDLVRKRTIHVDSRQADDSSTDPLLHVDHDVCRPGRVLCVHGLMCDVEAPDGRIFQCATRRLLKTLSTEQRHVVATGDRVLFRPAALTGAHECEGIIERVEPRRGVICREVRGRQQVLVSNVDQLLIVTSAAEPRLKPNLIDRLLVTAEKGQVTPLICINKIDLVDPAGLQPLVGVYCRMGYEVLLLSAADGRGIERLRRRLAGRQSVVTGQSGVGKSSLLNRIDPSLQLPVKAVSLENEKGRHTTTSARLIPLKSGGYVVDTPGVRQFQLWDVIPAEVAGFYRDVRPLVSQCHFPDCTHVHEEHCAVKNAVADGKLDERRYESFCHLFAGKME